MVNYQRVINGILLHSSRLKLSQATHGLSRSPCLLQWPWIGSSPIFGQTKRCKEHGMSSHNSSIVWSHPLEFSARFWGLCKDWRFKRSITSSQWSSVAKLALSASLGSSAASSSAFTLKASMLKRADDFCICRSTKYVLLHLWPFRLSRVRTSLTFSPFLHHLLVCWNVGWTFSTVLLRSSAYLLHSWQTGRSTIILPFFFQPQTTVLSPLTSGWRAFPLDSPLSFCGPFTACRSGSLNPSLPLQPTSWGVLPHSPWPAPSSRRGSHTSGRYLKKLSQLLTVPQVRNGWDWITLWWCQNSYWTWPFTVDYID